MIFHIKGKAAGADVIANALRNSQIAGGKGATIIPASSAKDLRQAQLEKVIVGPLVEGGATKQRWKTDAMVIIVGGDPDDVLKSLETIAPGVTKALGPFHQITVD